MKPTQRFWDTLRSIPPDPDGWRELTQPLSVIEKSLNVSQGYCSTTLRVWEKAGRVTTRKAGSGGKTSPIAAIKFLDDVRPTQDSTPEETKPTVGVLTEASSKEALLSYLKDHASDRGYVRVSNDKARRALHLSSHDFNKLLFDLRDMSLVSFNVTGTGSTMTIRKIRIRPAALVKVQGLDPAKWPDAPKGAYESDEGWLVVGNQAFTEFDWKGTPGKQYRGEYKKAVRALNAASKEESPLPPVDNNEERWPFITELIRRAIRITKAKTAVVILRDAAMNDEADLINTSVGALTQLEEEVVAFMKELHANGWKELGDGNPFGTSYVEDDDFR